MTQARMEETRFDELSLRIGAHYLYTHQGDCEHIITVADMSLPHASDVRNAAAYPLLTFQARSERKVCTVCNSFTASVMTYADPLADACPAHYCQHCFLELHCDEAGNARNPGLYVLPYLHS